MKIKSKDLYDCVNIEYHPGSLQGIYITIKDHLHRLTFLKYAEDEAERAVADKFYNSGCRMGSGWFLMPDGNFYRLVLVKDMSEVEQDEA